MLILRAMLASKSNLVFLSVLCFAQHCVHVGHFVYVIKQYRSAFLALLHFTCFYT